ncbi:hypothetical protein [Carboxylicivirga taeanensis]|uniref:hypothetical protein n=1 Tax=Carboxylicivirga taeanensis TaxID=1416875 RepID=UPI003F6DF855
MQKFEFHRKYRELLERNAFEAPDDVWNNITAALDNEPNQLDLTKSEQDIVDEVWSQIENELDIDEVWGKINTELDEKKQRPLFAMFRYRVAAAVILFLLALSATLYLFTDRLTQPLMAKKHQYIEQRHGASTNEETMTGESNRLPAAGGANVNQPKSAGSALSTFNTKNDRTTTSQREELDAAEKNVLISSKESSDLANIPIQLSGSLALPETFAMLKAKDAFIDVPGGVDLEEAVKIYEPEINNTYWIAAFASPANRNTSSEELPFDRKDSKWTTGLITAVKNTYLLNQETLEGFSSSGMNSSKLSFQPDLGINVQYALNQRYILETNIFLKSSAKQSSNFYSYGEYVSKEMQLNYMASELLVKQNAKKSYLNDKLIRRNVAGVYVGHMNSATEMVRNESLDITSKYAALDYGVLLGQEFELRSKGPIKVSTGISIKYGLPNVYKGDANVPENFNRTHNASLEFRIGLAYRWKSKVGIDHYLGVLSK